MSGMRRYGWAVLSALLIWMIGIMPAVCLAAGAADSRAVTVMVYLTGSDLESGQAGVSDRQGINAGRNQDETGPTGRRE